MFNSRQSLAVGTLTPLSFAVENVGDTIARAFFHASSFIALRPCSRGPAIPSTVYGKSFKDKSREVTVHMHTRRLTNTFESLMSTCRRRSGSDRRMIGVGP